MEWFLTARCHETMVLTLPIYSLNTYISHQSPFNHLSITSMTRTERASYPRALNRDRSESRNGLDASLRKRGAGNHNWGSLVDEHRLEATAQDDEENEFIEEEEGKSGSAPGGTFRGTFYVVS